MTAWVTSDHHLWHETVGVTHRGFQYIDQHNDFLAWQWDRSGIKDGDDVYVLGDCALGENRFRAMGWYATRPGVKHLILGNHDRCVDEESEALTNSGWKKIGEIGQDDLFATINPDAHLFEWQRPSEIFVTEHDGPMWHFTSRSVDHLVSPNHDLYISSHGGPFKKRKAGTFQDGHCQSTSFLTSATADPSRVSPPIVRVPDAQVGKQAGFDIPMDVAAPLFGWYVAEGSSTEGGAVSCRVTFSQSQTVNPEHYEEICTLLDRAGINYTRAPRAIRVNNRPLSEFLSAQFGGRSQEKKLPTWISELSTEHFNAFLSAYLAGDGSKDKRSAAFETYTVRTSSQRLADDMQAVAVRYGWMVRIGKWRDFPVAGTAYVGRALTYSIRRRNRVTLGRIRVVDYKGLIWCPTLANGLWMVRRNGKALWTGNCHPCNSNAHRYLGCYRTAFASVQLSLMLKHSGHKLLLHHMPYEGDHGEDRFTQWRLRDEGLPIIHGHTHSDFVRTFTSKGTVQLHAGVDAWDMAPVKLSDLVALLDLPKDED